MDKVILLPLESDLVGFVIDELLPADTRDFSRFMVVFPGKRPGYFLRNRLAKKLRSSFYPPEIHEIDAFVYHLVETKYGPSRQIDPLNAAWLIYQAAKKYIQLEGFDRFYPWGVELYEMFNEMDQELIDEDTLSDLRDYVELSDDIIHGTVKELWENIAKIKADYTSSLVDNGFFTSGSLYRLAANLDEVPEKFTIFAGFYALTNSQLEIIKRVLERGEGTLVIQGSKDEWPIIRENVEKLGFGYREIESERKPSPQINIISGEDAHAEIAAVKDILGEVRDELTGSPEDLAIVVPNTESLIPLIYLSVAQFDKEFNIALGYPFKRTPLVALFSAIFKAQENKNGNEYLRGDILKVLTHPFVKNIGTEGAPGEDKYAPFRIAIHHFEDYLFEENIITVNLQNEELMKAVEASISESLKRMNFQPAPVISMFRTVIELFFKNFENVKTFQDLKEATEKVAEFLLKNSALRRYRLNLEFMRKFFETVRGIDEFLFKEEEFPSTDDIFNIFLYRLNLARVAFEGTPVKGIQVIGALEARGLNFKNLIYLDVNEGVIPGRPEINPILPPPLRGKIGLKDYTRTEEIYRYHFKRLLAASERAYLLYVDNSESRRSRYIEEYIWQKEKEAGRLLEEELVKKKTFNLKVEKSREIVVEKTPEILKKLEKMSFSPSAINTYVRCPLRFYYSYVMGLAEKEFEDSIEGKDIGILVHSILRDFYGQVLRREPDFEKVLTEEKLHEIIEKHFESMYPLEWGLAFLIKESVKKVLDQFLEWERERFKSGKRFEVFHLEKKIRIPGYQTGTRTVTLTGAADRIDRVGEGYEIIDYKTGSPSDGKPIPKKIDEVLIDRSTMKKFDFQLPMYIIMFSRELGVEDYSKINARLLYLRDIYREKGKKALFDAKLSADERKEKMDKIEDALKRVINEILSPDVPFIPDKGDANYCSHCKFKELCGREEVFRR